MAKQHGLILLTGQLGGISFYEMDGKYYARRKTAHSAERIRTDPKFEKTYRNSLDFGTASSASKLLRKALGHTVKAFADNRMYSRMTGRFQQIVASDTAHTPGKRQIYNGDLSLLEGFELNKHASFEALGLSTAVSINRLKGLISITILPAASVTSTGARLVASIACVNFHKGTYTRQRHTISLSDPHKDFTFRAPLNADPHAVIIVSLGLAHGTQDEPNAMAIVAVHQQPASTLLDNRIKRSLHIARRDNRKNMWHTRRWSVQTFPRARENACCLFSTLPLVTRFQKRL